MKYSGSGRGAHCRLLVRVIGGSGAQVPDFPFLTFWRAAVAASRTFGAPSRVANLSLGSAAAADGPTWPSAFAA